MSDPHSPDPKSPAPGKRDRKRLNQGQILILVMGALVVAYAVSMIFGNSLDNYEKLKQAAADQQPGAETTAPATTETPKQ